MNPNGNNVERKGSDVMQALRAADPAALADLTRTDERAFTALREGITMTARDTQGTTVRRGRRALAAGGLAVALVGGGAAYATYDSWYVRDGGAELTCLNAWVGPNTDPNFAEERTGGPVVSADPVADCQKYQEASGEAPIDDPVAFMYYDRVFVAPRSQVPDGAGQVAQPSKDDLLVKQLDQSLSDYVDGGNSRCFDLETGTAFAKAELARLGLSGWTVAEQELGSDIPPEGPCGWFVINVEKDEVLFSPHRQKDPSKPSAGNGGGMYEVADLLRTRIGKACVALPEAEAITAQALGTRHHWPVSATEDPTSKCTTVDLQVGGSMQVFLRGPSTIAK